MTQPSGIGRWETPTWTGGNGSSEESRSLVVGGAGIAIKTETVRVALRG